MLATLSPEKYPRLVECAAPLTACNDPEEHFRYGVDTYIAGWRGWPPATRPGLPT